MTCTVTAIRPSTARAAKRRSASARTSRRSGSRPVQDIALARAAEVAQNPPHVVVADAERVDLGDGIGEAGALEQGRRGGGIDHRQHPRRRAPGQRDFGGEEIGAQLGQRRPARQGRDEQAAGAQRPPGEDQRAGQVADGMEAERGDQVDTGVGQRQPVGIGDDGHADAGDDVEPDRRGGAADAGAADIDSEVEPAAHRRDPLRQVAGERGREKVVAGPDAPALPPARGAVERIGGGGRGHVPQGMPRRRTAAKGDVAARGVRR